MSDENQKDPGWIYVLWAKGDVFNYFKIGKSKKAPTRRIAEYSPLLPFETKLLAIAPTLDMSKMERALHEEYAQYRVRGEWFRLSLDITKELVWLVCVLAAVGIEEQKRGERVPFVEMRDTELFQTLPEKFEWFKAIYKGLDQ